MLGNQVELWETMLAAMKLAPSIIPATPLLGPADLRDRLDRGRARHVIVARGGHRQVRRRAGRLHPDRGRRAADGWLAYADADDSADDIRARRATRADDTLLLYFTSGTTAQPKLVEHTHASYPVGHLSTMYWIGLRARRRPPEHLLARLGQARLVQRLRALERRGDASSSTTTPASTPPS